MGLSFSCPGADLEEGFEALLMRSISFTDNVKSTLRSVSFNGRDAEPAILKAWGSGKLFIEGSLSFNRRQTDPFHLDTKTSTARRRAEKGDSTGSGGLRTSRFNPLNNRAPESPVIGCDSPRHEAAVKLQKVYKSFRTRRQLADCAVLVEQRWWKLLDFALLKRSSVSFFDIEKPESAVSRWSRARTRAAKVGKGLSKDEKAQKLALQHWLEAIDPRHRYGHNLQYYYLRWLRCQSRQPFFYWLDVGEGKEVSLEEQCPRSKLQQQCIKYLGPKEREAYEVVVEDGKFVYKKSTELLDTSESPKDAKWIFVLCTSKRLYVGQKKKGVFQHSSFLAGGATSAAGRLEVQKGILKAVWPHSGHYRPTEENFQEFMSFLKENNVDLTDVKKSPSDEDEDYNGLGRNHSEWNLGEVNICTKPEAEEYSSLVPDGVRSNMVTTEGAKSFEPPQTESISTFPAVSNLEGGKTAKKPLTLDLCRDTTSAWGDGEGEFEEVEKSDKCSTDGEYESAEDLSSPRRRYMFCKQNLFEEEQEEDEEAAVPQELILRRINSKKGLKSYQLGQQLSFKWTTGAGPRIGCVRDYPSELQFRALEQVSLSPRGAGPSRFASPRNVTQSPRLQEMPSPREAC